MNMRMRKLSTDKIAQVSLSSLRGLLIGQRKRKACLGFLIEVGLYITYRLIPMFVKNTQFK